MAGIYLHIPFCKTRCIYCDFYSTTRSELKTRYVQALCRELTMRKEYLKGEDIETIYFGGGTPSQLEKEDFEQIFDTIREHYGLNHCQEITLEANPDDLSQEYLEMLSSLPFNRLSMGIQTFDDATLKLLRRRHNARTAIEAIDRCRKADFQNISIDLIYGLPGETKERWENDLRQAISLNVEHISAYHLIYEEDTPIYNMLKQHQISEVDEDSSLEFFTLLIEHLQKAGFEHYEISNFCRPGKYSRHNTSYWKGIAYLERRTRNVVQAGVMAEFHRARFAAVLAADTTLELRFYAAAFEYGFAHQLADAVLVEHLERVVLQDAFFDVNGQEFRYVVAREPERHLRQVVRAEREEFGLFGDLVGRNGCARDLDHRTDHVVDPVVAFANATTGSTT